MPDDQQPTATGPGEPPGRPPSGDDLLAGAGSAAEPSGPSILSRQELQAGAGAGAGRKRRGWWYVIAAVAVVLAGTVIAVVLSAKHKATADKVATTVPPATAPACPLTGEPSPSGSVPARPALAVKVGNYPDDRPSAGLNQADLVFEEPVEGAITRLVAVFQCEAPSLVGDVRSAREPDVGILSQLSRPLFVHAGGINPVIGLLQSAPIYDENLYTGNHASAIIYRSGRYAPYSTFVNTSTLWGFNPLDATPPAPIFTYSSSVPAGTLPDSGGSVHIPFSQSSNVTWTWSASGHAYLRSYSGVPDRLLDGSQTAAANVVVMTVQTFTGPWLENDVGGYEVEVNATGSGPLTVLRDGIAITGTWSRSNLTQPAALTASSGAPISLQPGNTWIELVPQGIPVTTTALAPTSTTVP